MVEGKKLVTNNQSYENPITFVRMDTPREKAESILIDYTWERVEEYSEDGNENIHIAYPKIVGEMDGEISKNINLRLQEYAISLYDKENTEELLCDYEVTYSDEEEISVLFCGTMKWKGNPHIYSYAASFNFCLKDGEAVCLLDQVDLVALAKQLKEFKNCKMLNGMDVEHFKKQLEIYYPNLEDNLSKFDFKFDKIFSFTAGYSYRTKNGIGLIIPVADEKHDYAQVFVPMQITH